MLDFECKLGIIPILRVKNLIMIQEILILQEWAKALFFREFQGSISTQYLIDFTQKSLRTYSIERVHFEAPYFIK